MTVSSSSRCVRPEILEANVLSHLQLESDHPRNSLRETLEQRHRQETQSKLPLQLLQGRRWHLSLRRQDPFHRCLSQRRRLLRTELYHRDL